MARITVEDCLHSIDNLFDLVLLASKRSRQLANGAEARVEWENDKPTVVALREIAAGEVTIDLLDEPDPEPEAGAGPDPGQPARPGRGVPRTAAGPGGLTPGAAAP